MTRYAFSFLMAASVVGLLFFVHWAPAQNENNEVYRTLGSIDWSIIGAASVLAALSVWGMIGVALSKAKMRAEKFASRRVVISKKSWHYRLNRQINFGAEPSEARSECEYWAKLFHGLYALTPVYMLISIVIAVIGIMGWLFSARTNPKIFLLFFSSANDDIPFFNRGNQLVGPITLTLLLIVGLAAGLTLSGAYQDVARAPWLLIGEWLGIVAGPLAGGAGLYLIATLIIWPKVLAPIFSYVGARIAGVCRSATFTD